MKYRQLSQEEQAQLVQQGCTAVDWTKVEVVEGFMPEYVQNVAFSGRVRLGRFERVFTQPGGFEVHSGVYYTRLHNVTIGDNCYIDRVHNYIANYEIGNDCFNSNARTCDNAGSSGSGNQDKNYAENDPAQTAVTGVRDELHDRSNKIRSEMFLYVDENSCIPTHRKPHKVKIYLNIVILNS